MPLHDAPFFALAPKQVLCNSETMLSWSSTTVVFLIAMTTLPALCRGQSNCTKNFKVLEKALLSNESNVYALTTTFFPPNVENPLYVTVRYRFPSATAEYRWSKASLYLSIHPRMLRFLSLLFCDVGAKRIVNLDLELPEECTELANNTESSINNFLFVLTERVS